MNDSWSWYTLLPMVRSMLPDPVAPEPPAAVPSATLTQSESGELSRFLELLASAPKLLVATDFDGTISCLADTPDAAVGEPKALAALGRLSAVPGTAVAVVSGRGLKDLQARLGGAFDGLLAGSHGAETSGSEVTPVPIGLARKLESAAAAMDGVAAGFPGALIERKPRGVAFHFRMVEAGLRQAAASAAGVLAEQFSELHVRHGSSVVELTVEKTGKGAGLSRLRDRLSGPQVLYLGDDITDEDAFAQLVPGDVGVKVGHGETLARWRLGSVHEVTELLVALADQRSRWISPSPSRPSTQMNADGGARS